MKKKRKTPEIADNQEFSSWEPRPQRLHNGYDAVNQAGVINGRYTRCANPEPDCKCYGCTHEGKLPGLDVRLINRRS